MYNEIFCFFLSCVRGCVVNKDTGSVFDSIVTYDNEGECYFGDHEIEDISIAFTGFMMKNAIFNSVKIVSGRRIDFKTFDFGSITNGKGTELKLEKVLGDFLNSIRNLVINHEKMVALRPTLPDDVPVKIRWILSVPAQFQFPHRYIYQKVLMAADPSIEKIEFVSESIAGGSQGILAI